MHYRLELSKLMFLKKSNGRITSHRSSIMLLKTPTLLIKQKYTMFSEQKRMSLANDVIPLLLSSVNYGQYLRLFAPFLFHIPDIWIPLLTFTLKNRWVCPILNTKKFTFFSLLSSSQMLTPFPILGWIRYHPTPPWCWLCCYPTTHFFLENIPRSVA